MNKKFLFSIPLACLLLIGCSSESKDEAKKAANTTIDKVAEATNTTAQKATQVIEEVKKETAPIVEEVVEKSKEVMESSKEVAAEVAQKATDMKESVQKTIHEATAPSADGKALFVTCSSCHGQNGEKKALNSSKVIQGWSKDKVLTALKGYKDGSYGGVMKGVMLGQVKNLDDAKMEALASYISSL